MGGGWGGRQTDIEGGQTDRQRGKGGGGGGGGGRQTCSTGTTINLSSGDQNQKNASLDWQETHKADSWSSGESCARV